MRTKELFAFMKERHAIYTLKEAGRPKPWTDDEILQRYRFCNIYRELDTETKWLAANWRAKGKSDFWFAAAVFRLTNWHETAEALGYPAPWNPEKFVTVLKDRQKKKLKTFTGAYMIRSDAMDKVDYLAERVLSPMWKAREKLRPRQGETLRNFYSRLIECSGLGSFMAGQIVADVKYTTFFEGCSDWWTFAVSGPGSKRGLNRIVNCEVDSPWREDDWYRELMILKPAIDELLEKHKMPPMHAQDLQNAICEMDKYERVRCNEGAPRALYDGTGENA